ncbi:MAG: SDR family oxidoreductase [Hyphomicrobiaceae bacterium]
MSIVTGGSEGVGLAIAKVLAARGHDLLLIARRPDVLSAAAKDLGAAFPVKVATLALDLTHPEACEAIDAELGRLRAHVHMLVNAAAIGHSGAFAEAEALELGRLVQLNVEVPTRLMRHVLPGMRRRRSGGILNVASLGGYTPGPYQAAYYASKSYLISLSEAVAAEARADGVRVAVVAPGPVETAFHAKMDAERAFYRRLLPSSSPETVARWAVRGFELGMRVIVPGVFNLIIASALRFLPHTLLVPVMAWLLHPRRPT